MFLLFIAYAFEVSQFSMQFFWAFMMCPFRGFFCVYMFFSSSIIRLNNIFFGNTSILSIGIVCGTHPKEFLEPWLRHQMETFSMLLTFVQGIHLSPMNSPHKGLWRRALMFSLICAWTDVWENNRDTGDSRRHHDHYDVTLMFCPTAAAIGYCPCINFLCSSPKIETSLE